MFWFGNPYKNQLEAFFDWARNIINEDECVFVDLSGFVKYFYFKFPLYPNAKPVKSGKQPIGRNIAFKISLPSELESDEKWIKIFGSPEIEILENKSRIKSETKPLRWGLVDSEKSTALNIARRAMKDFLDGKELQSREYSKDAPNKFNFKADVDVAIWTNGSLRGSALIENNTLIEGVLEGAKIAINNSRFKPLMPEEFENTRVEIVIMSDVRLPLSKKEMARNMIYSEKGYILRKNGHSGCFLPQVHNVRHYFNLSSFLSDLALEKLGIVRPKFKKIKNDKIFIFEVEDFIENEKHDGILSLLGPMPKPKYEFTNHELELLLRKAADWLCGRQKNDGSIPTRINPQTGQEAEIDWPRFAFTAWSLAEFGKITNETKYCDAAKNSFTYLKNHLFSPYLNSTFNTELTLAYFGRLAFAIGKNDNGLKAAEKIVERLKFIPFQPVTFAQIASFFEIISPKNEKILTALEDIKKTLKKKFKKSKKGKLSLNVAFWAELANVFWGSDPSFSREVIDWLKGCQLFNGSFSESINFNISYSNGTAKILEILAVNQEANRGAIQRILLWLFSMQYNNENTFFIPYEFRHKVMGGLRHNYFNQEAWSDAAAHFILSAKK